MTYEGASDRFVPLTRYVARSGPPALDVRLGERSGYSTHTFCTPSSMDRSSDRCCQDGGFRLTDVSLCKVFVNN